MSTVSVNCQAVKGRYLTQPQIAKRVKERGGKRERETRDREEREEEETRLREKGKRPKKRFFCNSDIFLINSVKLLTKF